MKIKGTMAAVLYATRQDTKTFHENCAKMVETIAPMLEVTDKKQVAMFARWFTVSFGSRVSRLAMKAVRAIKNLKEVKGVFATAVEQFKQEAMAKGLERGLEKGRQEGQQEGLRKAAKAMVEQGAEVDFIHKVTGLSLEEIRSLAGAMPS